MLGKRVQTLNRLCDDYVIEKPLRYGFLIVNRLRNNCFIEKILRNDYAVVKRFHY